MHQKYTTEEMNKLWSEAEKLNCWWQVEEAVLKAFATEGEISTEQFENIVERVSWAVDDVKEKEKDLKHDLLAFLEVLQKGLGELSAPLHRGLTSSDVKDTALSLRLREALDLILKAVAEVKTVLTRLARKHRETVMIGRTHGVHAEPTTFGLRCLNWLTEWRRQTERLQTARETISVGKISGAVGTYAQVSPEIEAIALGELNLNPAPASTQILQRDRHAHLLSCLANLAGSVERMALEVRNLQRTEILELEESFGSKQKGSSAMPHKRNPIVAERLCGQARCLRSYAANGFETQALWHERDLTNSSVERITFPDAFNLAHYMMKNLHRLFENLKINEERMRENIFQTRGLVFSQRVMVALTRAGWDRKRAYEKVQRFASRTWDEGEDFRELVKSDSDIQAALSPADLEGCFCPEVFLENIDEIYSRVLEADCE